MTVTDVDYHYNNRTIEFCFHLNPFQNITHLMTFFFYRINDTGSSEQNIEISFAAFVPGLLNLPTCRFSGIKDSRVDATTFVVLHRIRTQSVCHVRCLNPHLTYY